MNKALLIWNLVLTILLVGVVISGCGPEYDLAAEMRTNRQAIEQLSTLANENRNAINNSSQAIFANKVAIETFASTTEVTINALQGSLIQYIEQYIKVYVAQVIK